MAEQGIARFALDHVEVVDQPALDTVETIRKSIEELTACIDAGALSSSEADDQLDRLQRQLSWLESVVNERKKTVKLCEKVEITRAETFAADRAELTVLIGGAGGSGADVEVLGWDEPHIQASVDVHSYDAELSVARRRAESVAPTVTDDLAEALSDFGYRDVGDVAAFRRVLSFKCADVSEWLDAIEASPAFFYVAVPLQDWVSVAYAVPGTKVTRRSNSRAIDLQRIVLCVPRSTRLRVVANGATVRGMRSDVDVIAYEGGVSISDAEGDVRVVSRIATGGDFHQSSGRHVYRARRIPKDDARVRLTGVRGSTFVRSDAAEVHIEDVIGAMDVKTTTSRVEARLSGGNFADAVPMRFASECGAIELILPEGARTEYRLETDYGEILYEAGKISESQNAVGDDLPLYVGSGSRAETQQAPLQARTVAGNIHVHAGVDVAGPLGFE